MVVGFIANLLTGWFLFWNQHGLNVEAFQVPPKTYRGIGKPRSVVSNWNRPSFSSLDCMVVKNHEIKFQGDDSDASTTNRAENLKSKKKRDYSLNSEIYHLRKKRNGSYLAEQRLERAIHLLTDEERGHYKVDYLTNDQLPDEVTFNSVIMAHAKNAFRDRKAAGRGERLLRRMEELSKEYSGLRPTIFTYNSVMEAYSQSINASSEGSNAFREPVMIKGRDTNPIARLYMELQGLGLVPNTYTWNLVLASVPQDSKQWVSLEKWALAFLRSEKLVVDNVDNLPDRQTYNVLFKMFASSGAFGKAELFLQQLSLWNHQQREEIIHVNVKPSRVWYHCVLKALATTNELDRDAKEKKARELLREMNELSRDSFEALQPNTETFNHALNVFALTGDYLSAVQLLDEMERDAVSNPKAMSDALPDCVSFTTVIKSFATAQQNPSYNKTQLQDLAEGATVIFERMRKFAIPNDVTCKSKVFSGNHLFRNF
jgi:hypothetical protein